MPQSETSDQQFAQRIQKARTAAGFSQAEAAELWGVSKRTLQNWEQGHRAPSGFARTHLEKLLAEILDAPAGTGAKRRRSST